MSTADDKPRLWKRSWIGAVCVLAVVAVVVLGIGRKSQSQGWNVILMWPPSTWGFGSGRSGWLYGLQIVSHQYGPIMFTKQYQAVTNVAVSGPGGVMQGK